VWEQIRSNRRRSGAVVAVMGVVLVATGAALAVFLSGAGDPGADPRPAALAGASVALAVWAVLWIVSVASGDRIMLSLSHAREIEKQDHPQLFNVVEEMSIAAALGRVPRVFVVDDPSPNAFAVGRRPEHAAVAVTTGLLRLLDRDELQGVVAHEIGHVRNRDTALMATAGVMLGTIVLLADLGVRSLYYGGRRSRASSRDDRGGGGIAVLIAIVFMVVAPLLAQALYFALSRRREYLADASGALFTRFPEGLASALEKLGASDVPLADQSRVTAPMYTVPPRRTDLFDTHPPIAERIRILRAMGGGAGFGAYEAAYRGVTHRGVVGARTLAQAKDVPARGPAPAGPETADRARQASDALFSAAGYRRVECRCGAVLKVPPALAGKLRACPRCGADIAA
jgi:heat shock protein HtpX